MKQIRQSIWFRAAYVALCVLVQAAVMLVVYLQFRQYIEEFFVLSWLLSAGVVLYIANKDENPAFKLAWLIPMMLLPLFGALFYLFFGRLRITKRERKRSQEVTAHYEEAMQACPNAMQALRAQNAGAATQAQYMQNMADALVYQGTQTQYLAQGELFWQTLLAELEQAERFIFMEYFIVQEGTMWDAIHTVLARKASQGVDVRVVYDDVGCMLTLPEAYDKKLEAEGIKCCVFNRFKNIFSARFNHRDHRKICVIDGNVGFTGGVNLADEYINAIEKHGHWKDTAVMLKGEAVWSFTVMFLSLWDYMRGETKPYLAYAPTKTYETDGFVQPFTDSPFDGEIVGETVYMNMIARAERTLWITSPYLIIDNEMITALATAAKSGVDVRIITPGIADKKFVHQLTRSYYAPLLKAGVKIYEYTPGFIHAKSFVVDGAYGVVGTINLDYRSLYLHYECATWMYQSSAVQQLQADYIETIAKCTQISPETFASKFKVQHVGLAVLRIFAPLM